MAEDDIIEGFDPLLDDERTAAAPLTVEAVAKAQRDVLMARKGAYARVFAGKPLTGDVEAVMSDLMAFCRGDTTPWHVDPRVHALLSGRHEVYQRIRHFTTLPLDKLVELYTRSEDT